MHHYKKGISIDGNFAHPQATTQLRNRSTEADGSAASRRAEAHKSVYYVCSGHVSFDECSYKLTTVVAVEHFGCLGKSDTEFVNRLVTSVVGGPNIENLRRKGVVKERLIQIVSVTTQGAIFRGVERYRLALCARREARQNSSTSDSPDALGATGGRCATRSSGRDWALEVFEDITCRFLSPTFCS